MAEVLTVEATACAVCGHAGGKLLADGRVRGHQTRRVDSRGKTYVAKDKCRGSGHLPEPMEVVS